MKIALALAYLCMFFVLAFFAFKCVVMAQPHKAGTNIETGGESAKVLRDY